MNTYDIVHSLLMTSLEDFVGRPNNDITQKEIKNTLNKIIETYHYENFDFVLSNKDGIIDVEVVEKQPMRKLLSQKIWEECFSL